VRARRDQGGRPCSGAGHVDGVRTSHWRGRQCHEPRRRWSWVRFQTSWSRKIFPEAADEPGGVTRSECLAGAGVRLLDSRADRNAVGVVTVVPGGTRRSHGTDNGNLARAVWDAKPRILVVGCGGEHGTCSSGGVARPSLRPRSGRSAPASATRGTLVACVFGMDEERAHKSFRRFPARSDRGGSDAGGSASARWSHPHRPMSVSLSVSQRSSSASEARVGGRITSRGSARHRWFGGHVPSFPLKPYGPAGQSARSMAAIANKGASTVPSRPRS